MKTNEDIDGYLLKLERDFQNPAEGVWIISDEYDQVDNLVVCLEPPLVTFRIKLMGVPSGEQRFELFELLLRKNTEELVTGAFGIEDTSIVLTDSLQAENLDYNEFSASVDSLTMAIGMHYHALEKYRDVSDKAAEQEDLDAFEARLDETSEENTAEV